MIQFLIFISGQIGLLGKGIFDSALWFSLQTLGGVNAMWPLASVPDGDFDLNYLNLSQVCSL